jgi:hypothetical protein
MAVGDIHDSSRQEDPADGLPTLLEVLRDLPAGVEDVRTWPWTSSCLLRSRGFVSWCVIAYLP